jgi:hypothetical protein
MHPVIIGELVEDEPKGLPEGFLKVGIDGAASHGLSCVLQSGCNPLILRWSKLPRFTAK